MVKQYELIMPPMERGCHLITHYVINAIKELPETGILNVFLKHTSAGLSLNENADATVRIDLNNYLNQLVPENKSYYKHTDEGPDDITAHIKTSLIGQSLTIPISNRRLNLGTWQGIYLCEFRNCGGKRKIILSLFS